MKYISMILLILLATPANADGLFYGPVSYHFDRSEDLNELNHVIGVKYESLIALTFNNSHKKQSWFLGSYLQSGKYHLGEHFSIRANLYIGALYGYQDSMPDILGWTIGVAPTVELLLESYSYSVEVFYLPSDGGVICAVINYYWSEK